MHALACLLSLSGPGLCLVLLEVRQVAGQVIDSRSECVQIRAVQLDSLLRADDSLCTSVNGSSLAQAPNEHWTLVPLCHYGSTCAMVDDSSCSSH